jgi:hypothetical protein
MGKGKKLERDGSSKHSKTKKSRSSKKTSSSDAAGSTENEYMEKVLDLKATCADWGNLFSRSIQEDRRMLQCEYF